MLHWIKENPQWVAIFLYTLFECAIGKIKSLRSNSLIELVLNFVLRRKL